MECDNITMRKKLIAGGNILALRFDHKWFLSSILFVASHCDYKRNDEFFGEKIESTNKIDKIHSKCDATDGSVLNGVGQPALFSFVLDKTSGYNVFCEPETIP